MQTVQTEKFKKDIRLEFTTSTLLGVQIEEKELIPNFSSILILKSLSQQDEILR